MRRRIWLMLGVALSASTLLIGCLGTGAAKAARFTPSGGPLGGSDAAWQAIANGAKVRMAVYTDVGPRGNGMFRWLQLIAQCSDATVRAIDGDMVRNGVLDDTDVVVMPGGWADDEAASLKPEGKAALKAFIARGGSYIGTCAGCYLVMQNNGNKSPYRMGIIPFKDVRGENHGVGELKLEFLSEAEKCGLKPGKRSVMYAHGPIMIPGDPITNTDFKVVAKFHGDIAVDGPKQLTPMSGKDAMVAGTYGKGRVFASSVHPEDNAATWDLARKILAWAGHRKLTFAPRAHEFGNLSVGVITDMSCGSEAGDFVMKLERTPGFDVAPVTTKKLKQGHLRRMDVVVLPNTLENGSLKSRYGKGKTLETLKEFVANGGMLLGWGSFAEALGRLTNVQVLGDVDAAMAALRCMATSQAASGSDGGGAVATQSAAKKKRAAVYLGKGGGSPTEARLLEQSPEYEVYYVDGPAIAAGALKGADILIQGGGGGETQFKALGEQGQANLREYILNGGGYHGTCAGAFMMIEPTRRVRMNMVPYRPDDPDHYRGGADTLLKATAAGKAVLGSNSLYRVCYHGGPAMVPSKPIAGANFQTFLEYYGNMINSESSKPMLPMNGKAALVGGTCGKGRVVLCGPHPEVDESSDEIFLKTVGWVTGVLPQPVRPWHKRGMPNVGGSCGRETTAWGQLMSRLLKEPGINYLPGQSPLSDVLVLSSPDASGLNSVLACRLAPKGRLVILNPGDQPLELPARLKGAVVCKNVDEAHAAVRKILAQLSKIR